MDIQTEQLVLSLPAETARRLRAFTAARNGSIHNQAASAIEAGIAELVEESPAVFQDRYGAIFRGADDELLAKQ